MPKLLVIDDEPGIRFTIGQVFARNEIRIFEAEDAGRGLEIATQELPDVILLDIRLGSQSGLEVFQSLRSIDSRSLVIFITGYSTAETAIEAMKLGAYDYLVKPLDLNHLQNVVAQAFAISRMMRVPTIIEQGSRSEMDAERLVGGGLAMQTVCKQIGRIAAQDISVLILGESGTGKELVARAIYHHSLRSQKPFLAINCAAIPESLLESELFGHERGAFTGADRRRIGKFEQSDGGTLLLDEVGDMSPSTQAKILRVLQERRFERVGGNESLSVDVRLVAATNQNLDDLIRDGRFRRDLYYRLRGVTIQIPPLRDRREDIAELAHYFLFRYNRQLGTTVQSIAPAAMELLEQYGWPGNVRELESAIREALITSTGMALLPEFLPAELRHEPASHPDLDADESPVGNIDWQILPQFVEKAIGGNETDVYRRARDQFDRLLILRVLQHAGGNQNRAAEILGLSRVTLRARLRAMKGFVE
jgi:two-component system nitrogen regulation response regulator GlnG